MSDEIDAPTNDSGGKRMTRRDLLLALPGLAVARRLVARPQAAPLRVRGLNQVTLSVSDLDRSLDFYQGLFGMSIQSRHGATTLLRIGDGPQFLALAEAGTGAPRIDHFGMAVEEFDVDRVVRVLAGHEIAQVDAGEGLSGGAMKVRVTRRGSTPEVHMGDPDGLVIQLQDPMYCGGSGPLGDACMEPASAAGLLALTDLSHFTINVPDPSRTIAFYRRTFGLGVQVMQAATPALGVGTGVHFLMFIGAGGGRGRAGGAVPAARINHVCFGVENFSVERTHQALEEYGIRPREGGSSALRHWVSMRMPNRGGAPEGTPELYFSDPDGLSIQLQDQTYCGGGGYLGAVC